MYTPDLCSYLRVPLTNHVLPPCHVSFSLLAAMPLPLSFPSPAMCVSSCLSICLCPAHRCAYVLPFAYQ